MVVGYWVGLTLIWVFHHNAQQTCRFCQMSISPGRTGQAVWNVIIKIQPNPLTIHHPHPVMRSLLVAAYKLHFTRG